MQNNQTEGMHKEMYGRKGVVSIPYPGVTLQHGHMFTNLIEVHCLGVLWRLYYVGLIY